MPRPTLAWFLCLWLLAACGSESGTPSVQDVVNEPVLDAGTNVDTGAVPDAEVPTEPDVVTDITAEDAAMDAAMDAAADIGSDAVVDAVADAMTDTGTEAVVDATMDATIAALPDTEPFSDTEEWVDVYADTDTNPEQIDFLGGDRPAMVFPPGSYDPGLPIPVVVLLHGEDSPPMATIWWWSLDVVTMTQGILLIVPEATLYDDGSQFWQDTNPAMPPGTSGVDDVTYIAGLVDEAMMHFPIDPTRVYMVGISSGGFMAHRMACDRSDLVAGIVSIGGTTWHDPADCGEPSPVAVLQAHGTWDLVVHYEGIPPQVGDPEAEAPEAVTCLEELCSEEYTGCLNDLSCSVLAPCYRGCLETYPNDESLEQMACQNACWAASTPLAQELWMTTYVCGLVNMCFNDPTQNWPGHAGAEEAVARWAGFNGCDDTTTDGEPKDFVHELPGEDTFPKVYDGCPDGAAVELWAIEQGSHKPGLKKSWAPAIIEWLLTQQKPNTAL